MTALFIVICLIVLVVWVLRLVNLPDEEKPDDLPKQVYGKGKLNHRRRKL